jgi:hypothetical protein
MSDLLDRRLTEHMENDDRVYRQIACDIRSIKETHQAHASDIKTIKENHLTHIQISTAKLETNMKIVMAGLGSIIAAIIAFYFKR